MQRFSLLLPCSLLLATACGSPGPFSANGVIFWEMTSGSVAYAGCPDSPAFLASAGRLDVLGRFLVYRVSPDGTSAVQQACDHLDATSCVAAPDGLTWTIEQVTLHTSAELRAPVGSGGCTLLQTQRWAMTVTGKRLAVTIADALSLVGLADACDEVQATVKAAAPNGLGLAGCVITYQLGAELR